MTSRALSYVVDEVRSYLPSGWSLTEPAGSWDARRRAWTFGVLDAADQDWSVAVKAADAEKLGRLEALKRALDRVWREGLG